MQKWIIFAYFVKKGPKFVSHDSLRGKDEKINYLDQVQKWTIFFIILTGKKSKIDFRAKVDNFCLFCVKGS